MLKRLVGVAIIATLGLTTLTACDPPYPPELIETIYEQNPVCEPGAVTISADSSLETLIGPLNDTMVGLCPEMSLDQVTENGQLVVTLDTSVVSDSNTFAAAPIFADAGVAVINFSSGVSVTLSLDVLFKILSGEITTWNDPAILSLNKKIDPIDEPIVVNPVADQNALGALEAWAKLTGVSVPEALLTEPSESPVIDLYSTEEGTISILPLSNVLSQGLAPSSIKVASKNLNAVVPATDLSVFAGASQFVAKDDSGKLVLNQDPTLEPELPKGAEKADIPYQAVYFGWLALSGEDNLQTRAAARFLLRMDEQGTLPAASLVGLPTKIRQAGTKLVSKGLTLPKVEIKK